MAALAARFGWTERQVLEETAWWNIEEYMRLAHRAEIDQLAMAAAASRMNGEALMRIIQQGREATAAPGEDTETKKKAAAARGWASLAAGFGNQKAAKAAEGHARYLEATAKLGLNNG